eukprot:2531285-Amphidinium_carterae.1
MSLLLFDRSCFLRCASFNSLVAKEGHVTTALTLDNSTLFSTSLSPGKHQPLSVHLACGCMPLFEPRTIVGTFEISSQDGGTLQKDLQVRSLCTDSVQVAVLEAYRDSD